MIISFQSSPYPTIGVEVELQILDKETRELANAAPLILDRFKDNMFFKPELIQSTLEINTGICRTVRDVYSDLREKFCRTKKICDAEGLMLAISGTHPFSKWESQKITENERYSRLVEHVQWPARRLMIFGLHIHIGVPDGEKAIAVANALNPYLPHLLALSASSPFWDSEETGLASTRVKIFETLPTAGLPYQLTNWSAFQRFMKTLITAGAIETIREVWWDIRPHPGFGTIEMRVCDGVPSLKEICGLAALYQCLVVWLSRRYEEGDTPTLHPRWIIRENKWRASRWGLETDIISSDTGETKNLAEDIADHLERLKPTAEDLDCLNELHWVTETMLRQPSYLRQKKIYAETGDFMAVCDSLVDELYEDI